MEWVQRIGDYDVERQEGPRPGGQAYLPLRSNPSFCVHTTEGSTVAGAVATLRQNFTAPHFVVGENRIVQMRPLSAQGATVHDWNDRFIQVECVGRADLKLHRLTPTTWQPLVALTRFVNKELGIPLRRPDGWSDQLAAGTWANNNPRRQSGIALQFRGVFGHVDVPDQDPSWHWDPGSLDYTALFAEALGEDDMTDEQKAALRAATASLRGVEDFLQGQVPPDSADPARKQMYKALKRAASEPVPVPGPAGPKGDKGDPGDPGVGTHSHAATTTIADSG